MRQYTCAGWSLVVVGLVAASAPAAVTVSKGASAPSYGTALNFDEVGGPTGFNVPANSWSGLGITSIVSGEGSNLVGQVNTNPGFGWLGTGNVFAGPFGVYINFGSDINAFSTQYWDASGPADFMGGGAIVVAFNDGAEVGSLFIDNPAYGGVGDTWINIVGDGGSVFDEVRLVGFGFTPDAYVDNLSWNKIPAPTTAGGLALAGVAGLRRRRN